MTCVHCGRNGAYKQRRPKKGIEETICEHCGRIDTVKIKVEQIRLPLEEPVCRS